MFDDVCKKLFGFGLDGVCHKRHRANQYLPQRQQYWSRSTVHVVAKRQLLLLLLLVLPCSCSACLAACCSLAATYSSLLHPYPEMRVQDKAEAKQTHKTKKINTQPTR